MAQRRKIVFLFDRNNCVNRDGRRVGVLVELDKHEEWIYSQRRVPNKAQRVGPTMRRSWVLFVMREQPTDSHLVST